MVRPMCESHVDGTRPTRRIRRLRPGAESAARRRSVKPKSRRRSREPSRDARLGAPCHAGAKTSTLDAGHLENPHGTPPLR